ncbi:MAG TPA: ribbon-helix-helix protein, CopG family [Baekduia sp.]|jgi:hypothetical protein
MPNPRNTLQGAQEARIEIRAPKALLDEIKSTAEARGRTSSDVLRVAVHCLHLADRIDALYEPNTAKLLGGDEKTVAVARNAFWRELGELLEGLLPELSARYREGFLAFALAEASGR